MNASTAEALALARESTLRSSSRATCRACSARRPRSSSIGTFVPPADRQPLLDGSAARLIGVHGHNIPDSVASFLPLRGIIVGHRLDHAFIAALAERSRAA